MKLRSTKLEIVLAEPYTLPGGMRAHICIVHGKGGYGGWLKLANGHELPLSIGNVSTARAGIAGAKSFLAAVYGRSN